MGESNTEERLDCLEQGMVLACRRLDEHSRKTSTMTSRYSALEIKVESALSFMKGLGLLAVALTVILGSIAVITTIISLFWGIGTSYQIRASEHDSSRVEYRDNGE